jgi:two-component system chemotaxis response regulator CheY
MEGPRVIDDVPTKPRNTAKGWLEELTMTTVLVVDDTHFLRMRLVKLLAEQGYDVVEAVDGVQAVDAYQATRPDLVLMDIVMPLKTGLEALTDILRLDPQARVIMLTALGQEHTVFRAFQLGARDYLLKPYSNERLLETIEKVLGSAPVPDHLGLAK